MVIEKRAVLYALNFWLTRLTLLSILLAYVSILIFGGLVLVGVDHWFFVAASYYLSKATVIISAIPFVLILISREYLRGLIYVVLALILTVPFIYVEKKFRDGVNHRIEAEKLYSGEYNLRLLGKKLLQYAKAHDGCLPPADQWCDQLMEFSPELTKSNFRHPQISNGSECHFSFNANLGGKNLKDISAKTILLFESDGDWNLNGTGELLRSRMNNEQVVYILYSDGTPREYWFSERSIRDFESNYGSVSMHNVAPRWNP